MRETWFCVSVVNEPFHEGEGRTERLVYIQAESGRAAAILALSVLDMEGPLHSVHVGRAVKTPRDGYQAFGWIT